MPSSTIENYVKHIYLLQQESGQDIAPMGKLAAALAITPGTATTMVKALADSGLAEYEPRVGVRLTPGGRRLALHVLRRHRLVESFLVKALGLDWAEVHEEAEQLEHVISDKVLDRIDEYLNRPLRDPHGDPIPGSDGSLPDAFAQRLNEVAPGMTVTILRVLDQNADFLGFADRHRLIPGTRVEVRERRPEAQTLTLAPRGGNPITIGLAAAEKIAVVPELGEERD